MVQSVVSRAWDHAPAVIALALLVAAAALIYSIQNFSITTDRKAMLSQDLPFRQAFARYHAAFPGLPDNLVVVIDAESPEVADG